MWHTWNAYKVERNKYHRLLKTCKKESISNKVAECVNDTRKLFGLMRELTNSVVKNPLPESGSDRKLANEFAAYTHV